MLREQYLAGLKSHVRLPIPVDLSRLDKQEINAGSLSSATELQRLFHRHGIKAITVGSMSALLQIGEFYARGVHDLDFVVASDQIDQARQTMSQNGYDFWDENHIHREVRNLTGGFGRHHNFGASSPAHLSCDNIPIWVGFFTFSGDRNCTVFQESYAISRFKVLSTLQQLWQTGPDFDPAKRRQVENILKCGFTVDSLNQVIELLKSEDVDFWTVINDKTVNELDIRRRLEEETDSREEFAEVEVKQVYDVDPSTYFGANTVNLNGANLPVIALEATYWRMRRFFPHYLGARPKYIQSAGYIEESGALSEGLQKARRIAENVKVSHAVVDVFLFGKDPTVDEASLSQLVGSRAAQPGKVNYWSLLLQGVHFREK